jgi:HEPN domain-containing protein
VSVNVHEIDHINYGLERGQYFFAEIVKEGIELFDKGNFQFADARPLSIEEQREEAEYYYKKWVESGSRMLEHTKLICRNSIEKGYELNDTMFLLHQTSEKLYAGLGLVFTGYKPKTHSIQEYQNHVKSISDEINKLFCFPPDDQEEERLFTILQKSYIDARYKDDYLAEKADVEKLIDKVERLERMVVAISQQRINSLKA